MRNPPLKELLKPTIIVGSLLVIAISLPSGSLDFWPLLSPKKIAFMIFSLAFIQYLGSLLFWYFGKRVGAFFYGFFGGLVSSTAVTASISRRTMSSPSIKLRQEFVILFSAILAMLIEGLAIVLLALKDSHLVLVPLFLVPIFVTAGIIYGHPHPLERESDGTRELQINWWPLFKLALFILSILSLSKVLQVYFAESGLLLLTSIVSLFEIHGSIMASVQLHDVGAIRVEFLCDLLAVSMGASILSKLFLISSLGSSEFSKRTSKWSGLLILALALGWALSRSLM